MGELQSAQLSGVTHIFFCIFFNIFENNDIGINLIYREMNKAIIKHFSQWVYKSIKNLMIKHRKKKKFKFEEKNKYIYYNCSY